MDLMVDSFNKYTWANGTMKKKNGKKTKTIK